jgi:hypothetical protein
MKTHLKFIGSFLVATTLSLIAAPPTYHVYATREGLVGGTTANGHVIQSNDHFCALPSGTVLNSLGGTTYTVTIRNPANGAVASNVPVWDIGPWNIHDNYWHSPRAEFTSLARGLPEAQAAYQNGFNGGRDDSGRTVLNPAGIDLADGTYAALGNPTWVDVTYNWEDVTPPPPPAVTSPSIVTRSDGKVEAFVVTSSTGDVQYREKASVGASWGSWVSLSGSGFYFVRGLAIDNGGVAVFGMGAGNILYKYLASSGAGVWSGWVSIAASGFTSIAPIMKTDGKMALVGCGNGTSIFYNEQTAVGPGASWSGWTDLAASSFWEVDALSLPNGGAAAFGVGSGSSAFYKYKSSSTAAWSSWANLGGSGFSHISAVKESSGKMAFFGCGSGSGSSIFYQEQSAVGPAASWSGWINLGGSGFSSISGVALPSDGIAVFGCTDNGNGSTEFYNVRTSGAWSGYVDLGASGTRRVSATADNSGLMTTVMRGGTGGSLWERRQTDATHWAGWVNLGNALK